MKKFITAAAIMLLAISLLYTASLMPPMGAADNPTMLNTIPRYLGKGVEEAGAENIITGIILNYRGYDTMGEVTVIFSALYAVLAVLTREKKDQVKNGRLSLQPSVTTLTTVRLITPFILLYAVYTILHGAVSPGGGFQGGAIIAGGLILFTVVFGFEESFKRIPLWLRVLLEGSAVISFFTVGLMGVFAGKNFLTYMLPFLSPNLQPVIRTLMLDIIEIGIGTGGAMIFTSIVFSLLKED